MNMNQQQIIKEILTFPIAVRKKIIKEVQKSILEKVQNETGTELSVEERLEIVKSLDGALEMKNPPMTKEEEREMITEYLTEKYK